jgi:hypothetical protein
MTFRARRVGLAASGWWVGCERVWGGSGEPECSSPRRDAGWDGALPGLAAGRRQAEFPVPG